MIQRQQTLWLILATACAILSFQFPFLIIRNKELTENVDAGSNFFLLILTGASIILSAVTIFLFKERKIQIRLCLAGLVLSILILAIYLMQIQKFQNITLALSCLLPVALIISYFMALRGIRKDEKLVKSSDKLR